MPMPIAGPIRVAKSITKNDFEAITLYPAAHAALKTAFNTTATYPNPGYPSPEDGPYQKPRSRLLAFRAEMTHIYSAKAL